MENNKRMVSEMIVVKKLTPKDVASSIISLFGAETIIQSYNQFEWQKTHFTEALQIRQKLEDKMKNALAKKDDNKIDEAINDIYYWGFRKRKPTTNDEEWKGIARNLVKKYFEGSKKEKVEALNKMLNEKGIGIATASKWICFCDQKIYAIYDSRVSLALRSIVSESKKRIFPIVARRSTKTRRYPIGDAISVQEMVESYCLYLDTLEEMNKMIGMSSAEIEMALFMLGKDVYDAIS